MNETVTYSSYRSLSIDHIKKKKDVWKCFCENNGLCSQFVKTMKRYKGKPGVAGKNNDIREISCQGLSKQVFPFLEQLS